MNNSKAIIFDLDGTLIPINEDLIGQVRASLVNTISKVLKISQEKASSELEKEIENTFEDDPYLKYRKAALKFMSPEEATKGFYHLKETPPPYDQKIYQTIKKLKEAGYFIAAVSNSSEDRMKKWLNQMGILNFIDHIGSSSDFLSSTESYPKLAKYKDILVKFNLKADNVYVVGDCYNLDLAPASLLGLKTILVLHEKSVVNYVIKRDTFERLTDILLP